MRSTVAMIVSNNIHSAQRVRIVLIHIRSALYNVLGLLNCENHLTNNGLQCRDSIFMRHVLQVLIEHLCFDIEQLITDAESSIDRRRSALHNFGHVDAIVTGNVLVSYSAGNGEAEAPIAFYEVDL